MTDTDSVTRSLWQASERLTLTEQELTELIQPVFPGKTVVKSQRTEGGLSNTNIRVEISDENAPYLVRLYTRDKNCLRKEVAINELTRNTVPSPKFLWSADSNEITGHPYVVMEWMNGKRLETLVSSMNNAQAETAGASIGRALAGIHSFTFEHTGFLDDDLRPLERIDLGARELRDYIEESLQKALLKGRIHKSLIEQLLEYFDRESAVLSDWNAQPCLTHCDFGGSNILINEIDDQRLQVSAVLDFEFAFSGAPYFDFGNLLRNPLGNRPEFVAALAAAYQLHGGVLPNQWRKISVLADLSAWVEFLTRPDPGDYVIADSLKVIHATMANWRS